MMATITAQVPLTQAEIDALHLALQGVDTAGVVEPLDPEDRADTAEALDSAKAKIAALAR